MKRAILTLIITGSFFPLYSMEMVTLRDGSEASKELTAKTYASLQQIMKDTETPDENDILLLCNLNEKAKNPSLGISHPLYIERLQSLELIDQQNNIPSEIALIIRNSLLTYKKECKAACKVVNPIVPKDAAVLIHRLHHVDYWRLKSYDHDLWNFILGNLDNDLYKKLHGQKTIGGVISIVDQALFDFEIEKPWGKLLSMKKPEILDLIVYGEKARAAALKILDFQRYSRVPGLLIRDETSKSC